jgi:hypothetical protein
MGVGVQNFKQLSGRADLLRPFVWSRVSGLKGFRDGSNKRNSIKFCINLENCATVTLVMIRQEFGEESMSRTRKALYH